MITIIAALPRASVSRLRPIAITLLALALSGSTCGPEPEEFDIQPTMEMLSFEKARAEAALLVLWGARQSNDVPFQEYAEGKTAYSKAQFGVNAWLQGVTSALRAGSKVSFSASQQLQQALGEGRRVQELADLATTRVKARKAVEDLINRYSQQVPQPGSGANAAPPPAEVTGGGGGGALGAPTTPWWAQAAAILGEIVPQAIPTLVDASIKLSDQADKANASRRQLIAQELQSLYWRSPNQLNVG